jgi:hypothetical protein
MAQTVDLDIPHDPAERLRVALARQGNTEILEARARDALVRLDALAAALRLHRCNVILDKTVGECVDGRICGCSNSLLLKR